jgi:hypothetical protein
MNELIWTALLGQILMGAFDTSYTTIEEALNAIAGKQVRPKGPLTFRRQLHHAASG